MNVRKMAKRAATPDGVYLIDREYPFEPDVERAFEKAGAFQDGEAPKLPERAEAPKTRARKPSAKDS